MSRYGVIVSRYGVFVTLVALFVVFPVAPARADCQSASGSWYVFGGNSNNIVRAVRTDIQWSNSPPVCASGVSNSIAMVFHGPNSESRDDDGFLQVGWRYYAGWTDTMAYCERSPNPSGDASYAITDYSVAHQLHTYQYYRANGGDEFQCSVGGQVKRISPVANLGFYSGDWVPVQAETHRIHNRLGYLSPNWLDFSNTEKVETGTTGFTQMNIHGVNSGDSAYNHSQPNIDGFRVNTDVSH